MDTIRVLLMNDEEMMARIEAVLYASSKPLSIKEIQLAAGTTSISKAVKLAREVAKKINTTMKSIEVVELDGSFVMQLKPSYNNIVKRFSAKPFLSNGVLKTLACIVHLQPVNSKRLLEIRGTQVYKHLKLLLQTGFIKYEKVGRNKVYMTSKKFQEYFGIKDGKLDLLKEKIAILEKA